MTLKSTVVVAPAPTAGWKTNCRGNEHLWYFDPRTEHAQHPDIYARLTERARTRIWTWDPYILGADDVAAYGNLHQSISVRVLADLACNEANHRARAKAFFDEFGRRFGGSSIALDIRVIDRSVCTGAVMEAWRFHDRYLVIDDEVYVVGGSMRAFRVRQAPHYVARITDPDAKELVLKEFIVAWDDRKTAKSWCGTTHGFKAL